jgi:hypothetical protein
MLYLTRPDAAEAARQKIAELFNRHVEWFHLTGDGNAQALKQNEFDINVVRGRLFLSCWTEEGTRTWKIRGWSWTGEKLVLEASRRMGSEASTIELIPRASADAIAATVKAARQARTDLLAKLACSKLPGARIERASISPGVRRGQPGRYARIILRLKHQRIAVTASVASNRASDVDSFISASLLWFTRVGERVHPPLIQQLWLVMEPELARSVLTRLPWLRSGLLNSIEVFEIDDGWSELQSRAIPERQELWRKRLARFPPVVDPESSNWTNTLVAEAPNAIDVVKARHGETLRYLGLPFARVRRVLNSERVWFGVDSGSRRMLDKTTLHDWMTLLNDLRLYRSAQASDYRHAFYRNASEAWLEALLRRDISQLDPGLIVAPLHAQFRTAPGGRLGVRPIDLLALRRDGRLVVIELKVTEDRDHVLQGVGYWQRVEAHRRRGHISRAKLFGDRVIRDEPPLVYLVAPTLRVHPAFNALARFIAPEIEIYRFDINEDWRAGVRVMRRMRVN